jgi:hypothetical protein
MRGYSPARQVQDAQILQKLSLQRLFARRADAVNAKIAKQLWQGLILMLS